MSARRCRTSPPVVDESDPRIDWAAAERGEPREPEPGDLRSPEKVGAEFQRRRRMKALRLMREREERRSRESEPITPALIDEARMAFALMDEMLAAIDAAGVPGVTPEARMESVARIDRALLAMRRLRKESAL